MAQLLLLRDIFQALCQRAHCEMRATPLDAELSQRQTVVWSFVGTLGLSVTATKCCVFKVGHMKNQKEKCTNVIKP